MITAKENNTMSGSEMLNRVVLMVVPSSFSADRKGYNAYLSACGIDHKDQNAVLMFAIPFEQFKAIDRETLDDKIAYAAEMCEKMHNVYTEEMALGHSQSAENANLRGCYFSKMWMDLVRQRRELK